MDRIDAWFRAVCGQPESACFFWAIPIELGVIVVVFGVAHLLLSRDDPDSSRWCDPIRYWIGSRTGPRGALDRSDRLPPIRR